MVEKQIEFSFDSRFGGEIMKSIIAYGIYLLLCGFSGLVCAKADIQVKDWKYWATIGCVIGAYLCGKHGFN